MEEIDVALLRALTSLVPTILAALVVALFARTRSVRAAALVATLWNIPALLLVHQAARHFGWWQFHAEGGVLLGVPGDVLIGWALLWGAIPAVAARRVPLAALVLAGLWIDLLVMPRCAPLVVLGDGWLYGEAAALLLGLVPGQILARLTAERRRPGIRAAFQAVCFAALLLWLLPELLLRETGASWEALATGPRWLGAAGIQLLFLPGVIGLGAVHELASRGGGTPIPLDPPDRLVTSGPYRYLANPMQLGFALVLLGWGALLSSWAVVSAALMALVFAAGFARWHEDAELAERFGQAWHDYRREVRRWWPRLRPFVAAPSRVYLAESCSICSALRRWLERRNPLGLELCAAEDHPRESLMRIRYEHPDGTPEDGVAAFARALEHLHLGWAIAGFALRLPLLRPAAQIFADAIGAGPRALPPSPAKRRGVVSSR